VRPARVQPGGGRERGLTQDVRGRSGRLSYPAGRVDFPRLPARLPPGLLALAAAVVALAVLAQPNPPTLLARHVAAGGRTPVLQRFPWPIRPFHRPHPIRGSFGEPRGILDLGLGLRGGPRALALQHLDQVEPIGRRVLHTGVDIAAPDGTPVYAVSSGTAFTSGLGYGRHVIVGRFGYWHLDDAVPNGTRVTALRTVIGRVYPGQGHVHLTRFGPDWLPLNPLVGGGLTPYRDTAPPRIDRLVAYDREGRRERLLALRGPAALAVQAYDVKSLGGLHTGLYRLSYEVLPRVGARPLVGPVTVFRFDRLPPGSADIYTLGSARHGLCTRFWYRLASPGDGLDGLLPLERLPPGRYRVRVTAADERGNRAQRTFLIASLGAAQGPTAPVRGRKPISGSAPGGRRARRAGCAAAAPPPAAPPARPAAAPAFASPRTAGSAAPSAAGTWR
jgi:hypothetical protein